MRIAFDASSMRGAKTGIGVYTQNLASALRRFAPAIEIVELVDAATVHQRTDRRILREQFHLPRLAQQSQVDILHLTGFAAPVWTSMPVVLTVHDLIGALFSANFPPAARLYWSRYLPFTLRFARHILADSENTKRDIIRLTHISPDRIHVIYPGRDEKFQPMINPRVDFDVPAKFFLFVSTLEPRKGVDTLIAAFARAASQVAEDLVIVGKRGWDAEKFFIQVERAGLSARVRFLDYVADEQMLALYNRARALVFPSRYEGFGLPPLEAMASGTPVICSNAASLPEVVGDAGVLLAPDDVDGFARAMAQLARDDHFHSDLRVRGLVQATKFSWERAARATLAIYSKLGART